MYAGKRFLAVIPARGGSKGVPRKNIRPLNGRPLLAYTVDQVADVLEIDLTVVSTEDSEIRTVAEGLGMRVIDRPAMYAADDSPTEAALLHVLDALAANGEAEWDYIIVLEPTSPLRSANTIRRCITTIVQHDAPSLLTVRESRENIGTIENGFFRPLRAGAPRRRQERMPFYVESSTVYVCRVDYLRATRSLVAEPWCACVVPDIEAVDINTPEDFVFAESLICKL
jgi:CMP-N,N'-diacetyllegionaminic acid synthase